MRIAFEENENALRLSKFNLKVAQQTYKMCHGDKEEQYLRELNPPKPEKKEKAFQARASNTGMSLSEYLS